MVTEEYVPEKNESLTNGMADLTSSSGTSSGNSSNTSPHRLSPQVVFKRPGDPVSFESPIVKRAKVLEEGRPLREISSVMMTTSGFLSPAREGKLPEARTPHQVSRSESPQPSSYPMVPPELKCDKKPKKVVKKGPEDRKLDKENKKKKGSAKELFKPDKIDDSKIKKLVGMKELAKLKPLKPGGGKTQSATLQDVTTSSRPSTPKIASPKSTAGSPKPSKAAQPKVKAEKVIDLTNDLPVAEKKEDNIDKLPSEPDKQKLNIFKKISKPREEKDKDKETPETKYKDTLDHLHDQSPELVIDDNNAEKHAHRNDADAKGSREEKRTPHTPDVHIQPDSDQTDMQSPPSDVYMFDDADISPPGTPSTPKTPELSVPTVPEQKRKKKEKSKKKESKLKSPKQCVSPKKVGYTSYVHIIICHLSTHKSFCDCWVFFSDKDTFKRCGRSGYTRTTKNTSSTRAAVTQRTYSSTYTSISLFPSVSYGTQFNTPADVSASEIPVTTGPWRARSSSRDAKLATTAFSQSAHKIRRFRVGQD